MTREEFDKISEVESIQLSPEALKQRAEFDLRNLSPEERRKEIIEKYSNIDTRHTSDNRE